MFGGIIESMLPPGVTMRQVQDAGMAIFQRLAAAETTMQAMAAQIETQGAMLRQLIVICQQQSGVTTTISGEKQNELQANDGSVSAAGSEYGLVPGCHICADGKPCANRCVNSGDSANSYGNVDH